ncbi:N-terminal glutamine amidase-domain-containing protein [Hysterangium stoloniferum]|nr:N-terminal glutamine amidase-domain-containing protein [Hysterangium stoloniferum]
MPPQFPPGYTYTPFYCEENIYLLAATFSRDITITHTWEIYVVFVSNASKTVALWGQKLATDPIYPVIWDYHCILVLKPLEPGPASSVWVFDYDSRLEMPHRWPDYVDSTFGAEMQVSIPEQFRSFFRIIPASLYLEEFASDRSHMLKLDTSEGGLQYVATPPVYPCIVGRQALSNNTTNNLMSTFVNMGAANGIGTIMNFVEFSGWACRDLVVQCDEMIDKNTTSLQ